MPQDKEMTTNQLQDLWKNEEIKVLDTLGEKYAILSDIHLGDGKGADDFHHNEKVLEEAIDHYYENNYSLILLGDIEEFWQFDLKEIEPIYRNTIYEKFKKFGDGRLHRVFGNHDIEWRSLADPARSNSKKIGGAEEALKMRDKNGNVKILLIHGHQGNKESDKNAWVSKPAVKLFRYVEPFVSKVGLYNTPSIPKSEIMKDYEHIMYSSAKKLGIILICGHSHRAIYASKSKIDYLNDKINDPENAKNPERIKEISEEIKDEIRKNREIEPVESNGAVPLPCYFNTGCALYPDGITAIEIENDMIKLIKWDKDLKRNEYRTGNLSTFIGKI